MTTRQSLPQLEALVERALTRQGVRQSSAAACARHVVAAEACGLETHGVSRVAMYCDMVRKGRIDGAATPFRVEGAANRATALVDAAGGLAYDACELAIDVLASQAQAYGVAFVGVRNSSHVGALGLHLETVARHGLVGLAFSNSPAAMPFWGGRRPGLGTNPVAAVFPRQHGSPLLVDLSMTTVARGHILLAAQRGESIPQGWALDAEGQPTTDAKRALAGSLLPVGGAKGAMLAMCFELLCAALTGSALSFEADPFFAPDGNAPRIGQAFIALAPGALSGQAVYLERVETWIAQVAADPEVRLPGARREALREKAQREGLELRPELLQTLQTLALP